MSTACLLLLSACLAAPPPTPTSPAPQNTEAEKIARLQRQIEEEEKQLAAIKQQMEDPDSEYRRAEADFKALDNELTKGNRELERLRKLDEKAKTDELDRELATLKRRWQRARDRFDLAVLERKTLQEKLATLPAKIEKERKGLERLLGGTPPAAPQKKPESPSKTPADPPPVPATTNPGDKPAVPEKPADGAKPGKQDKELDQARAAAKAKEEAAEKARDRAESVAEYLAGLQRQIDLEQRLLETARKKVTLAREAQAEAEQERRNRAAAGAPREEIERRLEEIDQAGKRVEQANALERESTDRLADLQAQMARVQARQITILQEAEQTDKEASSAKKHVDALQNPFNVRNVWQWLLDHGGKIVAIVVGMVFLYLLVKSGTGRIVRGMAIARKARGGRESEDRAETLVGVFRNTMSAVILSGGMLMLLDEVGIPIVPLMGGAAVFGLAVAFGAQNLIKDYFTGFMVLLEDQYAVNDVVRINGIDGKVERITLRMTVLRDLGGTAHFVPHGAITTVSNQSHGWSRATVEIGVAYKEDTDHVLAVLREVCAEVRRDERFAALILEDAEMLGVDRLDEYAVVLKFLVKTKPMKQWEVKRELLRRVKRRFDQLGIEIPFPHRTVYHRHDNGDACDDPRIAA
jgi:small-conductance mechanosensitive channel